jgi:S1/P1 Nuclease
MRREHLQRGSQVAAGAFLILLAASSPAGAWDANGHRVVARIAWDAMRPDTRERALALLQAMPPDADLAVPSRASMTPADRGRELFELAAVWPDLVRDATFPQRKAKYDHPAWHYVSWYWDVPMNGPYPGAPRDRLDLPGNAENIVERLGALSALLSDPRHDAAEKGVALAWVQHLVGDIHMPLHAGSRVTAEEPHGDQGGLLFKVDAVHVSLHWYWDSILTTCHPRQPSEDDAAYIGRLAAGLTAGHPAAAMAPRFDLPHFQAWANDGYDTAKTRVYTPGLRRGEEPSAAYRDLAASIAEPAIALAGYRLAALLDHLLAP